MAKRYKLDTFTQDFEVEIFDPEDGAVLDKDISPERPIMKIQYNHGGGKNASSMPMYRVMVFDPSHGMKWDPLDGPEHEFLKILTWYRDTLGKFSDVGRVSIGFKSFKDEIRLHMLLYTGSNKYSITGFIETKKDGRTYLGCSVSSRTALVGEDFIRSCHLAEGDYTKETWEKIIMDMFSHEIIDRTTKREAYWGVMEAEEEGEYDLGYIKIGTTLTNEDGELVKTADEPKRVFNI